MSTRFPAIKTLSRKGQVVVPLRFRRELGWRPGDRLALAPRGEGFALRKVSPALGQAIRDRQYARHTLTDDEVLLLAMVADPTTTDAAILTQVRRLRRRARARIRDHADRHATEQEVDGGP